MSESHTNPKLAGNSGGSGLSLWLIIFENTGAPDEVRNTRDVFRAHQADLERRGIIFGAGPLAEPDGKRVGRGMTILRAESAEHALEIAGSDPLVRAGLRKFDLYQWHMGEGHLKVVVNFSDGDYRVE